MGSRAEDAVTNAARWVLLAAIVAVAAFLRFDGLGEPSYWLDEILHQQSDATRAAAQPWWRWLTALHDEHGSLYYLTQLATRLFGTSEAAGRSAAALFGVATIPLVWFAVEIARAPPRSCWRFRRCTSITAARLAGYALLMFLTAALIVVLLRARSLAAACSCSSPWCTPPPSPRRSWRQRRLQRSPRRSSIALRAGGTSSSASLHLCCSRRCRCSTAVRQTR